MLHEGFFPKSESRVIVNEDGGKNPGASRVAKGKDERRHSE